MSSKKRRAGLTRREFSAAVVGGAASLFGMKLLAAPESGRPAMPCGVASGDVSADGAVVWSKTDRPARMVVEYATTDSFRDARKIIGPAALDVSDYTARVILNDLPPGQTIVYRVSFQDLGSPKVWSEPLVGRFRTPPREKRDVLFTWGGDVAGQGYGINPEWGGYRLYETMRKLQPDFFIHSGDHIYADNPLQSELKLDDGSVWKNIVTERKSKVAETLAEFRGNFAYNYLDEHFRRFNADVPVLAQWDDHETHNNWFPGQTLEDDRYKVTSADLLAARAKRAFIEYLPVRPDAIDSERVYRTVHYGPSLEVFVLDQRTYRGPNSANRQTTLGPDSAFHGPEQIAWLKAKLKSSTATWKVIASDMPIGLIVTDRVNGQPAFEAVAQGDGPPLGRELELADLFRFLKENKVRNLVWLTADVHYATAHYYDPAKAQFTEFDPFWEFIAGPINAGTFGPGRLDNTFGPQVKFVGIPRGVNGNRPPSAGFQFFGSVRIDAASEAMTVALHDLTGKKLYSVELPPVR
jgi:alkaline phosphatase D